MIRKLTKDWKPDYLAVVFDVAAPTFRDKLFAEYKAQRPPMPEDLATATAVRAALLRSNAPADAGIPRIRSRRRDRQLWRNKRNRKISTFYIVTSDKDLMQLVGGRVRMLNPAKGDLLIDAKKVEELMGVPPEKVADVMALMGDSIDNIPGARDPNEKPPPGERRKAGIGEVGARQLIQQYGSAEDALANASEGETRELPRGAGKIRRSSCG